MFQWDFQSWQKRLTKFLSNRHNTRKAIGIILIFLGLLALVTPFTPGSWLAFVGLEFLGVRFFAADKIKEWLKSKRKL
jgi:drug/metabolite transporter (DMT)-like permease